MHGRDEKVYSEF